MQQIGLDPVEAKAVTWEERSIPQSNYTSFSNSSEEGWPGPPHCWKILSRVTVATAHRAWCGLLSLGMLPFEGRMFSGLTSFVHEACEEFRGIWRSFGERSAEDSEPITSSQPWHISESDASQSPSLQVSRPQPSTSVPEISPNPQMSPVGAETSRLVHPSFGTPWNSLAGCSSRKGYYLIEWFLEPVVGPMIPMSSLVFCRGVPVRLGPSTSQYEAYWQGKHVSVNVATPCNGLATKQQLEGFAKSISLLRRIRHPGFAQVYGWCLIHRGSACELGIVTEWCNSGSILSMMRSQKTGGARHKLSWKQKLQLMQEYADAARHLHEQHQLLLGHVDVGNYLVHCTDEGDRTLYQGKIADLSHARFMLSTVPCTNPVTSQAENIEEPLSARTDLPSIHRILWSIAMLGELHADAFWSLPEQLFIFGNGQNEGTSLPQSLAPIQSSSTSAQCLPREFVRLMENSCGDLRDGKPTAADLSDGLKLLFEHYLNPKSAGATDSSGSSQQGKRSLSIRYATRTPSMVGSRQAEHVSTYTRSKSNRSPSMRKHEKVKRAGTFMAKCFPRMVKGCFSCGHALPKDDYETENSSSVTQRDQETSGSSESKQAFKEPVVEREITAGESSRVMSSAFDEINVESIRVLKKHFIEKEDWRQLLRELSRYWARYPQSSILRVLEDMVETISRDPTDDKIEALFHRMLQSPGSEEFMHDQGWRAVQTLLVNSVSSTELIPCAGFGVMAQRLEQIGDAILALPTHRSWLFDFDSDTGLLSVSAESSDPTLHYQMTPHGEKHFSVQKLQGQKVLESIIKRSKWVDRQLREQLRGHVRHGEDLEELVDALKHHMADRVLMWVVHTEAPVLLRRLPAVCTFRGVCSAPLSLVSEHFESRTLFDILKPQGHQGWSVPWTWLETLIVATRIARCLLEFHRTGLAHMTLTSRNVLVNRRLEVRLKLGPTRFVDSAVPVGDAQWIAPEKWRGRPVCKTSDMYSLGVILWELVSGCKPWAGLAPSQILISVINGARPNIESSWNRDYIRLMESCWAPDPESRPLCMEVVEGLQYIQEAARELISLSSGSGRFRDDTFHPGTGFDPRFLASWSSRDSNLRTRTIRSTQSEIQPEYKRSIDGNDDHADQTIGNQGCPDDALEELTSDFYSVESLSELGNFGSFQEDIGSSSSLKLQDNRIINELIVFGEISWGLERQCTNRFDGTVYSILRSERWAMPPSWTWKAEILGPWIAWRSTSTLAYLKRGFFLGNTVKMMSMEIAMFKKLNHPNLVKLVEVIEDGSQGMLLVSEHVMRVALNWVPYGRGHGVPEADAKQYMIALVECLTYLHSNRVVHRDLHPDNILLGHDQILRLKLSPYTSYLAPGVSACNEVCGNPHFFSPEMCDVHQGDRGSYCAFSADVYALGACLHVFLYGRPPLQLGGSDFTVDRISDSDALVLRGDGQIISSTLQDLLSQMLQRDPRNRINLQDITRHTWFENHWGSTPSSKSMPSVVVTKRDMGQAVALNSSRLFEGIPFVHAEEKPFSSGDEVFSRRKDAKSLFIMKDGWCSTRQGSLEGLAFPGSIFGSADLGLYSNKHGNVDTVHAMAPTVVIQVGGGSTPLSIALVVSGLFLLMLVPVKLTIAVLGFVSCLVASLWILLDCVSTRILRSLVNNQGRAQ